MRASSWNILSKVKSFDANTTRTNLRLVRYIERLNDDTLKKHINREAKEQYQLKRRELIEYNIVTVFCALFCPPLICFLSSRTLPLYERLIKASTIDDKQ